MIGVACGSVAAVLLIIGITVFLISQNSKENLSSFNSKTSSSGKDNQVESVDQELNKLAYDERK